MSRKLYLFYGVLNDYTSGIAGSIATSKKEAVDNIVNEYIKNAKQELVHNKMVDKIMKSKEYINLIKKGMKQSEYKKIMAPANIYKPTSLNHTGTGLHSGHNIRKELMNCKNVIVTDVNDSISFYIGGGS